MKSFKLFLLVFVLSFVKIVLADKDYQYAYTEDDHHSCKEVYDPYEKLNRKIFVFNSVLDHLILRPIAVGYKNITNDYTKARVGSFIDNISVPLTTVNYALQKNFDGTMKSFWRFVINTTFGIGGLFDIAGKTGLTHNQQTFGGTLAHYGVGPGPYIIIPFFGASNARDVTDSLFTNSFLNPIKHYLHKDFKLGLFVVKMINDRMTVLPFTDFVAKNSSDPYVAIRSSVHQNREYYIGYPTNFICPTIQKGE